MAPYIYGTYQHIHIINLEETLALYQRAIHFFKRICEKKGNILFVGTKRPARELVKMHAERLRMPYVHYRWLGGMLTNYKTIRNSILRLEELETMSKEGTFEQLPRKEVQNLTREMEKLNRSLGGIRHMTTLPDALFVIDVGHEHIAIKEARKLGVPIVGVVDTNNDPSWVDYVIPGNDDAAQAIELYLKGVVDACLETREAHLKEIEAALEKASTSAEDNPELPPKVKKTSKGKKTVSQKVEMEEPLPPELNQEASDSLLHKTET